MTETGVPAEEAPVSPSCYRHPDRETGVRCTRCERYICPDCMTEAAVGFQCPECVKAGRKSVREARTVFGGRVAQDAGQITRVLIGLNVAVFVLALLTAGGAGGFGGQVTPLHVRFADIPLTACPGGISGCTPGELIGVATGQYYRLLTSMFLHFGPFHLLMNMYALLMVGQQVERALGRWRFIALYGLAGLSGNLLSYWFGGNSFSAGASGAVFGLFGAYFVIQKRLRLDTSQMAMLIGINVAIGFVITGIDWRAHLGGLAAGAAATALFAFVGGRGSRRDALHAAGAGAILVALVLGIAVRTAQLRDRYQLDGTAQPRPAQPVKLASPSTGVAGGAAVAPVAGVTVATAVRSGSGPGVVVGRADREGEGDGVGAGAPTTVMVTGS